MGEIKSSAPKVDDGVIETKRGETLVSRLDVPFEEPDPAQWLRERRHEKEPTQEIFPRQG